ncbi:MAG TPA: hypothetical protein VMV66_02465, partial [Candidatus Humimicrobiaceae bacterium]|nr:hypothetical protein [Candidatus Humimicrobiaceae bacterium]
MTTSNQKKLLVFFGVLLFAGFLFFIPQEAYAINFTAGWYQDQGTTGDASCSAGYWRAYVELKDYEGNALVADTLRIKAIYYPEPVGGDLGIGYVIYDSGTLNDLASFETPCEIETGEDAGQMVLDIEASKDDYYTIKATNNVRFGGGGLNQKKWSKTLYLTLLITEPNLVYLFPDNNQWISASSTGIKIFVNKEPRPENITEIKMEIIHAETAQKFSISKTVDISEGEIVFPLPTLTGQGQYVWRISLMRNTPSTFYNEKASSIFYFDSLPPLLDYRGGAPRQEGEEQAPYIYARFYDDTAGLASGIDKIDFYLDDGYGGSLELVHTCSYTDWPRPVFPGSCGYTGEYEVYLEPRTYKYYAIAYDYVGNEKKLPVWPFTIEPVEPSTLNIRSNVALNSVTGVPFKITEVTPDNPGGPEVPEAGDYETNETFYGYQDYNYTLEAPDSYNEEPFSFWLSGSAAYNAKILNRTIWLNNSFTYTMYFGVSRLNIGTRQLTNTGAMSSDLKDAINKIITRIEQIEGTPSDLLGPDGYRDVTYNNSMYSKIVAGEIRDIVLRINASEDGILQPAGLRFSNFCKPDPVGSQEQCKGSIIYTSGSVTSYYSIQRKVKVEAYLGSDPIAGVNIIGKGAMLTGETPYTFSNTNDPDEFIGTLWATSSIIDPEDNEVLFGGWSGCQSVSPDGLGCYIGEGTWYDYVTTTVKAYYASEPDPGTPELTLNIIGNGTAASSPPGINCVGPATCSRYFDEGTTITLTANPAADSYFVGWTGACSGINPTCILSMDSDKQVQAEFALLTYDLTTSSSADGSVTVPGEGIFPYNAGTVVSLVATADSGYRFVNWTGDVGTIADVNDPSTTITMNGDYTIVANFEEIPTPVISDFDWDFPNPCIQSRIPRFFWNINTTEPYDYEIQICSDLACAGGPLVSYPDCSTCLTEDTGTTKWVPPCSYCCSSSPYNNINFGGGTYYAQVRARYPGTGAAGWSSWQSVAFSTYDHCYPWTDFDWAPKPPSIDQGVQFTDMSTCYDVDPDGDFCDPSASFLWEFPGSGGTDYSCIDPAINCGDAQNPK